MLYIGHRDPITTECIVKHVVGCICPSSHWSTKSIGCQLYRIVGNFRGVLIFVIFVTDTAVMKFCTPRKFAIVGKGRQTKVTAHVHTIVIERMALYQAASPFC